MEVTSASAIILCMCNLVNIMLSINQNIFMMNYLTHCIVCGFPNAMPWQITKKPMCNKCLNLPEYQTITANEARKCMFVCFREILMCYAVYKLTTKEISILPHTSRETHFK